MSMKKYNHAFSLGFSIDTDASCETHHDYPSDKEIVSAILKRVAGLIENDENRQYMGSVSVDVYEAIGAPWDTYENEPPSVKEQP